MWAAFFVQPGIKDVLPILALGFVFIPFGAIPQAVLGRDLNVRKTTIVTGVATLIYITTCVTLAMLGFSYMSMAWANLASIIVSGITLTLLMPKNWPMIPSFRGWKRVVEFGAGAMLTSSLKAIDTAIPDFFWANLPEPMR